MPSRVTETPESIEIAIEAEGREAIFREALAAAVALASPGGAEPLFDASVPLQAAGATDEELFHGILEELLRAAVESPGRLGAPRWLLFEPGRVTATLPLARGAAGGRALRLRGARLETGSGKASVVLSNGRH